MAHSPGKAEGQESTPRVPTGARLVAFLGVLWLAGVLTYNVCDLRTLDLQRDQGFYVYQAQEVARGGLPYRDVFDVKTPLTGLFFGAAIAAGRQLGLPDLLVTRLLSVAVGAMALPLLFLLALEFWPHPWWAAAGACSFLLFVPYSAETAIAGQPKVLLVVVMLGGLLAIFRRRWLLAGLAAGLAFALWQPMLMLAPVAVVASLLGPGTGRRRLRDGCWTAAGFLLPLLAIGALLWHRGALYDFWLQALVYPARYLDHGETSLLSHFRVPAATAVKHYTLGLPLFLLGLGGAAAYLWRLRAPGALRGWIGDSGQVAFTATFLGVCAFSVVDFQGPPDMFPLLLALPVWALVLLQGLGRVQEAGKGVAVALALLLAVTGAVWYRAEWRGRQLVPKLEVVARLQALYPTERMLVIGRPDLLVLARAQNETRWIILHDGVDNFIEHRMPGGLRGFVASLRPEPPVVAYLSQVDGELTRPLRDWVASEYRPSSTFSYAGQPFWIRRDRLQQAAAPRRG